MMEDSTINVRHSDDATLRDEDEMNKNQRNVLQIGEKEKKSSDLGKSGRSAASKYHRFADVLDVAAGRSDPGQNRVDNAYEGNYDSEKDTLDDMLRNSRFASSPTSKTPPKEKTSYSDHDDDIKAELLRAADEANQFLEARSRKLDNVLVVAAVRSDPGQNRVDNAYKGNYDGDKDPSLKNAPGAESDGKEDAPLIEKDHILKSSIIPSSPTSKTPLSKKILYSDDQIKVGLIRAAEESYLMSLSSSEEFGGEIIKTWKDIATAVYLDDAKNLKIFITNSPRLPKREIQRRILEAVELNSLKCLDVFCQLYEQNPVTNKSEVELFHRRYGLSFWPLDERPKETALHVLASKITSTEAMKVLDSHPKFLNDFSDVADSYGSTPLLLAIKCNNMEVVERLLLTKPDVNKRNRRNESPIYVAALNDHAKVINRIIETYSESHERTKLLENMKIIDRKCHSILYPASQSGKPKVLDLLMEQNLCAEFLEQEKKTEEWELFVSNVCAAGSKNLAKIILEEDCSLLEKRQGGAVTPLMRAAEANQTEIVRLIFDIKVGDDLLDLFLVCDKNGQNVFHYAVKNPTVLDCLLSKFVSLTEDYDAINKNDYFDNTPIKLAAVGKMTESFEMLLNYTTSKVDIFSAHLIHIVDIEVLKIGLLKWKEEDPKAVARLLRGDHEKHQPFLEAAKEGNIKLMEFLLELGANHLQRTANDQTALHYAVLSGKLEAVEYLLKKEKFLEMIDFTDEINITAAGYATQAGYSEILRCLLENNAQMKSDKKTARLNILDSAYGFFKTGEDSLKEIVEFCSKDSKTGMLQQLFEDSHFGADCIMSKLIEETPNVAMMIFDLCIYQNKYFTHRSYSETKVERRVSYSLFPFKPKGKSDGRLKAIQSMVDNKRDDCLGHPLVILFLNEKMRSSNIHKWFLLNILMYITFLLALTLYGALQSQGYDLKSGGMIALSVIVFIICSFHLVKEIIQMVISKTGYIKNFENYIEWVMYICAVIYVVPGGSTKADGQIAAGAIAVFLGWINFSLFLKRFSLFGIYIIMAKKVFLTVCKVLPLVIIFIAAFSLSLSLLKPLDQGFANIPISLLTTFVMMTGELDYRDTFLAGGPLHVLQKILLVLFIIVIAIAIMNLLTGLAVDDTNEIMNRSKEEKRIYKAMLVITLERNLHKFPVFSPPEIEYDDVKDIPDKKRCTWLLRQWKKVYDDDEVEEQLKMFTNADDEGHYAKQLQELREEIRKSNESMKENTTAMEMRIENRLKKIEAMLAQMQT